MQQARSVLWAAAKGSEAHAEGKRPKQGLTNRSQDRRVLGQLPEHMAQCQGHKTVTTLIAGGQEVFIVSGAILDTQCTLTHLILTTSLEGRCYYYPHCTDKDVELHGLPDSHS